MVRIPSKAMAVLLALLPVTLSGWNAHEHGASEHGGLDQPGSYACAIEHGPDGTPEATAEEPGWYRNGTLHRHDCVACLARGQRSMLELLVPRVDGLRTSTEQAEPSTQLPRRRLLPSNRSLRGPPA